MPILIAETKLNKMKQYDGGWSPYLAGALSVIVDMDKG